MIGLYYELRIFICSHSPFKFAEKLVAFWNGAAYTEKIYQYFYKMLYRNAITSSHTKVRHRILDRGIR